MVRAKYVGIAEDRPCDLFSLKNFAIATAYFSIGFTTGFIYNPLSVYLVKELDADPRVQNAIHMMRTLPWSFKLFYGLTSDAFPIFGLHRKPYLLIGSLLNFAAFSYYALSTGTSFVSLGLCVLVGKAGLIIMDVMVDTLVVERSRFEAVDHRGQMQASCQAIRYSGGLLGAIGGSLLYNKEEWGWGLAFHEVALIVALAPMICVLPWLYQLSENPQGEMVNGRGYGLVIAVSSPKVALVQLKGGETVVTPAASSTPYQGTIAVDKTEKSLKGAFDASAAALPSYPLCSGGIHHLHTGAASGIVAPLKLPRHRPLQQDHHQCAHTLHLDTGAADITYVFQDDDVDLADVATATTSKKGDVECDSSANGSAPTEDLDSGRELGLSEEGKWREEGGKRALRGQLQQIWLSAQSSTVWKPMIFIYAYTILQIPNVAWSSFLQLTLRFDPFILGVLQTVGVTTLIAGIMCYKKIFIRYSWRSIFITTSLLTTFFKFLQLILIFQVNTKYLHLSNYLFCIGDDVLVTLIRGINLLPTSVMYMRLCPDGSEGTAYAMLTTFENVAYQCSAALGNVVAIIWDVSNDSMRSQNVDGLWRLTVLIATVSMLPICLVRLLPIDAKHMDERNDKKTQSALAGVLFLTLLIGSIVWNIVTALSSLLQT